MSVGNCLVNCVLQMGHGLVITYVMVLSATSSIQYRAGYKLMFHLTCNQSLCLMLPT